MKQQPVPLATGCFYELPGETSIDQMKNYERWAKKTFANYVCRRARRLFFNFNSPAARDHFLSALERSLHETGTLVQRTWLN